ncbi:DNA topoisomerase I, partial [Candidatus Heimdallarchaeota archaeon]
LAKKATSFTIACDYDIEGEVIGWNILRFICKTEKASRMKFSTLTKPDLLKAYENKLPTIDWGQAHAGEARHYLDYYYGINLSRALTNAIKSAGSFKIMSTGRVQGPALKLIVDREKLIKAFVPQPFWQIQLTSVEQGKKIVALHEKGSIFDQDEAKKIFEKVKDSKEATISDIEEKTSKQLPPTPFDLTTLQTEAYRCFGISPTQTLDIAQQLYLAGLISYPRTSSQQLPAKIGFKRIISAIAKNPNYTDLANQLLAKKTLSPRNGKKKDLAHPAIYPTGLQPKNLTKNQQRIYDLIVRRTLATFADSAERKTITVKISCKGEIFIAKGTRTTKQGWHLFYKPYVDLKEEELPELVEKEIISVKKIEMLKKTTKPPKRYTQASIIKELESRNLGTKATRAQIIQTLYERGYIQGKSIKATELGIAIVETLSKYCPSVLDEKLTRHFEQEMEEIRENKKTTEQVLSEAKKVLTKILEEFKEKEKAIGTALLAAKREQQKEEETIGICPVCKEGILRIKKGKYGKFIACDNYPNCKAIFSIPKGAKVSSTSERCQKCGFPIIIIKQNRRSKKICLNPECPGKEQAEKVKRTCPLCKKGKLVVKKSIYGSFIACDRYPKCKYIEKNSGTKSEG